MAWPISTETSATSVKTMQYNDVENVKSVKI